MISRFARCGTNACVLAICPSSSLAAAQLYRALNVFKKVVRRLFDADREREFRPQRSPQPSLNLKTQILGRGHTTRKNFERIQILVIERLQNLALDTSVQLGEIAHHSRRSIDLAADDHFKNIVMSVPLRIGALSVSRAILRIRQPLRAEAMRCAEP